MGIYADIYVAVKTRSKSKALAFLDHFLPMREETANEYEYPQYSDSSSQMFDTVDQLMDFLEQSKKSKYNLYWHNIDSSKPNQHCMLFYTKDEALVFGISREADIEDRTNTRNEEECLDLMLTFFQTDIGYITYEDLPADSFEEFLIEYKKRVIG
jgi:hypothetical protein